MSGGMLLEYADPSIAVKIMKTKGYLNVITRQ